MPPISAPMNPKNAPPTCRSGAREAFSSPPLGLANRSEAPFPATVWAGVALAKPPGLQTALSPSPGGRSLGEAPSCAPTVKDNFLAMGGHFRALLNSKELSFNH